MSKVDVKLYDKYGDLSYVLSKEVEVQWEYNRVGGCGQAEIAIVKNQDFDETKFKPQSSIKVFIDDELRYHGKLIHYGRNIDIGKEFIRILCNGYIDELDGVIVREDYESMELSAIVKDIMQQYVVPNSKVLYDASLIETTDYSAQLLAFNHTAMDALALIGSLAGNYEWGVDRNRYLYFKKRDNNTRHVYVIGREVEMFEELRNDESIVNVINVFGNDGFISQLTADGSVSTFGRREANLFESSITEASDANQLGFQLLKNRSKSQRAIKFAISVPDLFIEETTPLGAVSLNKSVFSTRIKYGTYFKYGTSHKYGNIKRDQFNSIRYTLVNGGLNAQITLLDDVPNAGNLQKRVEYEVKDLQRR